METPEPEVVIETPPSPVSPSAIPHSPRAFTWTGRPIREERRPPARFKDFNMSVEDNDSGMTYVYTRISNIMADTIVNIWGVVKYYRPPQRCRGPDIHMMLSLVDPSCIDAVKLKCSLFCRNEEALPKVTEVGQIVRMHRVKISMFNNNIQAQTSVGFACLVFTSGINTPLVPKTGSKSYTFGDADIKKVKQLRRWYARVRNEVNDISMTTPMSLRSVRNDISMTTPMSPGSVRNDIPMTAYSVRVMHVRL
ncbi:PREDICTED: protection of telomeres protein 1-like [Priapulus caudatus]|uniref:Protection of telomeres protein 1-like n=1 Tax=Priapulus caudatus TaxID=37621 RepID=A0ABM1ET23_PRICU|nr:PREDICTED: protection of telomeres protein 1-like [Priapulus caudatus]